jgi:glycerol uptake facilitator-like aquaporin
VTRLNRGFGREAALEFVATSFLLIAVVGSGVMAENLSGGNAALALLANSTATGGALLALILAFGPYSGAHMNPLVSLAAALDGDLPWRGFVFYVPAQVTGAVAGVWLTHLMFAMPVFEFGTKPRTGPGQWLGEALATFGLLAVIRLTRIRPEPATAVAVAAWIAGAYWFTSSTSFANPAVTLARALTDSFAGIRPWDAPGFMLAQLAGFVLALPLARLLPAR